MVLGHQGTTTLFIRVATVVSVFEKLREGIVDYEKIRIIRELAAKSSDSSVKN
jgi:hypothetical protein